MTKASVGTPTRIIEPAKLADCCTQRTVDELILAPKSSLIDSMLMDPNFEDPIPDCPPASIPMKLFLTSVVTDD
jgi:hypothetical protein